MREFEAEYRASLRSHLLTILQEKPLSFDEIVQQSGGAYPSAVTHSLDWLCSTGRILRKRNLFALANCTDDIPSDRSAESFTRVPQNLDLYDPHPADYDWRFDEDTSNFLVERLNSHANHKSNIALFGVTTMLIPLRHEGFNPYLVNNSAFLLNELRSENMNDRLILHDLFHKTPRELPPVDFIIADPPWYVSHYKTFILRSAEVLRLDGLLFLSVFRWLTRPAAVHEREEINKFALSAGFDIHEVLPSALSYRTPGFEKTSLESEGIFMKTDSWRKSDLFVLRRVREIDKDLIFPEVSQEDEWDDFLIGKKRIKLKKSNRPPSNTPFRYRHVDEGKILRSVSRRSPLRGAIDLWTSKNEAYVIDGGVELLRKGLQQLQNGVSIASAVSALEEEQTYLKEDLNHLKALLLEIVE